MDRRIKAFLAIAKERNVTAAARIVGLEQPSLTRLLKKLEAELGAPLFNRLSRGVELTEFGESFRQHALRIEAEYRSAAEEIAALKGDHLPSFRIGAGTLYHLLFIPGLVQRLTREFPKTRLEVIGGFTPTMFPMLVRGELDVVLGRAEEALDRTYGLHTIPLLKVSTGVVMRGTHALGSRKLTADLLADRVWIRHQHEEEIMDRLTRYFQERQLPFPRIAITTTSFETALRIIAGSDLFTLAPMPLQSFVRMGGLEIIPPEEPIWQYQSGVSFRRSSLKYPIVERLTAIIRELMSAPDSPGFLQGAS
jgi:DNA-binding transcriptional LysR family regulator